MLGRSWDGIGVPAVSYTHLDVYKRQPLNNITDFESNHLAAIEFFDEDFPWRFSTGAVQNNRLIPWVTPVSYTHLDVYKRQLLSDPNLYGKRYLKS